MLSYYQILQVEETATDAEIKQAYRSLGKILHPDLNNNTTEANTLFRLLHQAYETLSDPIKRKAYDSNPSANSDEPELDTRVDSYKKQNELQGKVLKDYEKKLKDYKETVYLKSERERALMNEIGDLKERILKHEKNATETIAFEKKEHGIQEVAISENQQGTNWTRIILIIIGLNLGLFLSYLAVGYTLWYFF